MLKIKSYNVDHKHPDTVLTLTDQQFYEILRKIYNHFNFKTKIINQRSRAVSPKDGPFTGKQLYRIELFLNIDTPRNIVYGAHTVKGLYNALQLKPFKNTDSQALSMFLRFLEVSASNHDGWHFIREN